MTVQTQFHNYQQNPLDDPHTCSPLLNSLNTWLLNEFGGMNLGCYADRPVRGGTTPSTHGSGAARDWRYENPGPGRTFMLGNVMPTLLNMSLELGVDAVHDYVGCRIWRPPGTSGRPAGPVENGWKAQNPGGDMGAEWAQWLHIEIHPSRWHDTRSIPELLTPPPPPPQPPEDDIMRPLSYLHFDGNTYVWWGPTKTYMPDPQALAVFDKLYPDLPHRHIDKSPAGRAEMRALGTIEGDGPARPNMNVWGIPEPG